MAISPDSLITWADLTVECYNAITNQCCNINTYKNVPSKLQRDSAVGTIIPDNTRFQVKSWPNVGKTSSGSKWTAYWYANSVNLIPLIASTTVNNEWTTFLTEAKINVRSTKVIQAQDFTKAMGLYMQFMAYHLKPVYSQRQVFNSSDSQSLFIGVKYLDDTTLGGKVTPQYEISGINPDGVPDVTNNDIQTIVKNNLGDASQWCPAGSTPAWKDYILFNSYNNPVFTYYYLD